MQGEAVVPEQHVESPVPRIQEEIVVQKEHLVEELVPGNRTVDGGESSQLSWIPEVDEEEQQDEDIEGESSQFLGIPAVDEEEQENEDIEDKSSQLLGIPAAGGEEQEEEEEEEQDECVDDGCYDDDDDCWLEIEGFTRKDQEDALLAYGSAVMDPVDMQWALQLDCKLRGGTCTTHLLAGDVLVFSRVLLRTLRELRPEEDVVHLVQAVVRTMGAERTNIERGDCRTSEGWANEDYIQVLVSSALKVLDQKSSY